MVARHTWSHIQNYKRMAKKYIKILKWLSQSPDLNIIENFWAYIQDELWKINDKLKNRDYNPHISLTTTF